MERIAARGQPAPARRSRLHPSHPGLETPMIRARTPALVAALTLVLSFGSSVAFARSGAQVSLSTAQISAAPGLGGEERRRKTRWPRSPPAWTATPWASA